MLRSSIFSLSAMSMTASAWCSESLLNQEIVQPVSCIDIAYKHREGHRRLVLANRCDYKVQVIACVASWDPKTDSKSTPCGNGVPEFGSVTSGIYQPSTLERRGPASWVGLFTSLPDDTAQLTEGSFVVCPMEVNGHAVQMDSIQLSNGSLKGKCMVKPKEKPPQQRKPKDDNDGQTF